MKEARGKPGTLFASNHLFSLLVNVTCLLSAGNEVIGYESLLRIIKGIYSRDPFFHFLLARSNTSACRCGKL